MTSLGNFMQAKLWSYCHFSISIFLCLGTQKKPFLMEPTVCLVGCCYLCMVSSILWGECRSLVIFFIVWDQFNVSCCVSNACSRHIRPTTRTVHILGNLTRGWACMCVYAKYKLMVAKCCSFFALSYSFQSIHKFDKLIRINRPNANYMNQVPGALTHFVCVFVTRSYLLVISILTASLVSSLASNAYKKWIHISLVCFTCFICSKRQAISIFPPECACLCVVVHNGNEQSEEREKKHQQFQWQLMSVVLLPMSLCVAVHPRKANKFLNLFTFDHL